MTSAPAKFTFETDMAIRREKTRALTEKKLADLVEKARAEGYKRGHADGEKSDLAKTQQAIQKAAENIALECGNMTSSVDDNRLATLSEAVTLAKSIGTKLASKLIELEPEAELKDLIVESMSSLDHAPHLVIRCHPDIADKIRDIAEKRMTTSGFTGRLVVMGEPDIALGDGRIEWVDGGLIRDTPSISGHIDECIQSYLEAKGAPIAKEIEQ